MRAYRVALSLNVRFELRERIIEVPAYYDQTLGASGTTLSSLRRERHESHSLGIISCYDHYLASHGCIDQIGKVFFRILSVYSIHIRSLAGHGDLHARSEATRSILSTLLSLPSGGRWIASSRHAFSSVGAMSR